MSNEIETIRVVTVTIVNQDLECGSASRVIEDDDEETARDEATEEVETFMNDNSFDMSVSRAFIQYTTLPLPVRKMTRIDAVLPSQETDEPTVVAATIVE